MKLFLVYSDEYETHRGGSYEPPEYGADCVEVEAENVRDAKVLGLRLIRQQRKSYFSEYSDECPLAHLHAEAATAGDLLARYPEEPSQGGTNG